MKQQLPLLCSVWSVRVPGTFHFSLCHPNLPSMRYSIHTYESGNALATPLELRVSMRDDDRPLSGGSQVHLPGEYAIKNISKIVVQKCGSSKFNIGSGPFGIDTATGAVSRYLVVVPGNRSAEIIYDTITSAITAPGAAGPPSHLFIRSKSYEAATPHLPGPPRDAPAVFRFNYRVMSLLLKGSSVLPQLII
ncbi:hypothetical protein EVAR_45593_1 [Eumeta japonica]|uniref:Uncharacterized protein n=1 Tax=Eumeta variegata TaxID=151549 RepID=A0A4C1YZ06_EUMVA|nr:hypothetical protein EVAR_45593_1 [Eumeta japonica]